MTTQRTGLLAGLAAYLLWGLFPLYWPLLEPAGPLEILGHRIVWSVAFLLVVVALAGGFGWVRELGRRRMLMLTGAAVAISINWFAFIYGVNSERVVETSLGYFITPLVTVALAVVVLGERLRALQVAAIVVGAVAVLVLTVEYGHPPWIGLTIAATFSLYGLLKKQAGAGGTRSLAVETGLLLLPALVFLLWLGATGRGTFTAEGPAHVALLVGAGVTTAVPLMLFGAAAVRIPLAQLGLMQYLAPVMQFLIGVAIYAEPMPVARLAGFALVWIALLLFTVDAIGAFRRRAPLAAPAEPGTAVPALATR